MNQIDFIFNRLLKNPNLEDNVRQEVADYALGWLKRTPLTPDRDHALNSLLINSKYLPLEEKFYLRHEAQAWLHAYPDAPGRERLIINLNRLNGIEESASISEIAASLSAQPFPTLSEDLRKHVKNDTIPDEWQLRKGLDVATKFLNLDNPSKAAYYLSSLLVLAARQGNSSFTEEVLQAIRRLLIHPGFTDYQRKGFSRVLYQDLDNQLFPYQEEGENLLQSLGLNGRINT